MPTQPKTPVKSEARSVQAPRSSDAEVDAFLARESCAPVSADEVARMSSSMVSGSSFTPFISTAWLPTGMPASASISQARFASGVHSHG